MRGNAVSVNGFESGAKYFNDDWYKSRACQQMKKKYGWFGESAPCVLHTFHCDDSGRFCASEVWAGESNERARRKIRLQIRELRRLGVIRIVTGDTWELCAPQWFLCIPHAKVEA